VHELRWPVVVITNQAGIGRGLFDEAAFQHLMQWMCARFAREQAPIAKVYHCPYHPVHGVGDYKIDHAWRKPKPGMLLEAAADLHLDLARSALIGDRAGDLEAAAQAGVPLRILVGAPQPLAPPHIAVPTVIDALSVLRRELAASSRANGRPDRLANEPAKG
jgi:D-glycero-D-manno-heptose 1,7-bisphosphate phosphatase